MPKHLLGLVLLVAAVAAARAAVLQPKTEQPNELYKLPEGLLIGAGTSATQSEGATSEDGKAESVLDRIVHAPHSPLTVSNDVSADHYHKYAEDLAMAKEMRLTSHRFSISWSRILPNGDLSNINEKGIRHYHDYIKKIKENGMEPLVTMYHFDHPYALENKTGGWTNRSMVDYFVDYADLLFKEYGSEVTYWNPINEGNMYCIFMPAQMDRAGIETYDSNTYYQCAHNTILAHAKTYRLYKEKYYRDQKGFVGTSLLFWPGKPATTNYEDVVAANTLNDVFGGTMVHPLVFGDYPALTRRLVDERSHKMGLATSRLPHFDEAEKKMLIQDGPCTDFVALNVYSGYTVTYDPNNTAAHNFILGPIMDDIPFVKLLSGGGFATDDENVMKTALLWTWNNYHLPVVITENGYGDTKGHGIQDYESRGNYFSVMLRSLVSTMRKYSIPVISFHAWSLLDSYEFSGGYDQRPFGLIHVDYANKTLKRTLKKSSKFFIDLAETGYVPYIGAPASSSVSALVPSLIWGCMIRMIIQHAQT